MEGPLTHATAVQITAVHLPKLKNLKVIPISAIQEKLVFMHFEGEETAFVPGFPIELNWIKLRSHCELYDTSMLSCAA